MAFAFALVISVKLLLLVACTERSTASPTANKHNQFTWISLATEMV